MVDFNSISSVTPLPNGPGKTTSLPKTNGAESPKVNFNNSIKNAEKYVPNVSDLQQTSNESIMDLLAGKTDVNTVVSAVAKADMSFKLLVGVRNKLIEAYKQTMNMQV